MRTFITLAAVAGLALAQDTATLLTGPPMGVYKTAYNQPAITATTITEAAAAATSLGKRSVAAPTAIAKREAEADATIVKRDDVCVAQPSGISYVTSPDDPNTFAQDTYYSKAANGAGVPQGYTSVFTNIVAANSAEDYMGFTFMNSYDVNSCAAQCTSISGCTSFNVYFERDPTLWPDPSKCANPPSLTRIKCVWWGGLVTLDNAGNYGQMIADFYVAIAGSNGYENTARASAYRAAQATKTTGGAIATATATTNSVWIVYYSADSSTGSFNSGQAANSFNDCMGLCDSTDRCKAFTYVGGDDGIGGGMCYMKTSLGNPTLSGKNMVSCVRVVDSGAAAPSSSVTTTTTVAATSAPVVAAPASSSTTSTTTYDLYRPTYGSSTTAAVISTVSYSAAPTTSAASTTAVQTTTTTTTSAGPYAASDMSCAQMAAVSSTYVNGPNTYTLACGYDLPYMGDIGSNKGTSFKNCVDQCALFNGCQAFAYGNSQCYFKSLVNVTGKPVAGSFDLAYIARLYTASTSAPPSTTTTSAIRTTTPPATTTTVAPVTTESTLSSVPIKGGYVSTTTTTTTTTPAPTTPAPTTMSTSTIAKVTTTSSTSTAAATPTGNFYISVGGSNSPNNQYAYVNWFALGRVQFTSNKGSATQFKIDSNGYLRNTNVLWLLSNYVGLVDRAGGAWQRLGFRPSPIYTDPLKCRFEGGYVMCNNSGGFAFAGTCASDPGYLYFGAPNQISRGCSWTGLYPVAA